MPRVPTYRSERQLPGRLTTPLQGTDGIGEGLSEVGAAAFRAIDAHETKRAKARITDLDTQLRTWSREKYLDAQQNRQGKSALAGEESPGIYQEYDDESTEWVRNAVAKMEPRFQDIASSHLNSSAEAYRNRFAGFEAQQLQVYRGNVVEAKADTLQTELASDMTETGNSDTLFNALDEMRATLEENSGGQDVSGPYSKHAFQLTKMAVLAKAESDPRGAFALLENENVTDLLDPATVEALEKTVEGMRVEHDARTVYEGPGFEGLSYQSQLDIVKEIEDKDVQKAVRSVVQQKQQAFEDAKTERQYTLYNDLWDRAMGNDLTRPEIMQADLETSHKEHLLSLIRKDESGAAKANSPENLVRWYNARNKIMSGDWTERDVMNAAITYPAEGSVYPGHAKQLVELVGEAAESPTLGRAESVLRERYSDIYKKDEDKAAYSNLLNERIRERRAAQPDKPIGYEEILQIGDEIAKPSIEKNWWQRFTGDYTAAEESILAENPDAFKPAYEQEAPPSYYESQAHLIRQQGQWPYAIFNQDNNVFILGNKDGYLHIRTLDGRELRKKID